MMKVIKTEYTMRILRGHSQPNFLYRLRSDLTFDIRAHEGWAWSKVCRLVWRAWKRCGYIYYCSCVIKSARYRDGVSRAIGFYQRCEHRTGRSKGGVRTLPATLT